MRNRLPRPAMLSLLATVAVSAVLLVVWLSLRDGDQEPPVVRTLADVDVTWRCEAGHYFKASAQATTRECTTCGRQSTIVTEFECPTHGKVEVEAIFAAGAQGELRVAKFRAPGGEWVSADQALPCSKCGTALKRKAEDPLDKIVRSKRKGG